VPEIESKQMSESTQEPTIPFERERDAPKLARLAQQNVWIGTSSYKYQGWLGSVYKDEQLYAGARKPFVKSKFEENCLREFSLLYHSVCYDGGYYRIPTTESLEKMAASVPDDFQIAIKVTDSITQRRFNNGPEKGQMNPGYLEPRTFVEHFLPAVTEGFGKKLGPIIFEFSPFFFGKPFAKDAYQPSDFVKDLDRFLRSIPHGEHKYSVEVRDPILIDPSFGRYLDCLEYSGVAHVLNEQTWMPELQDQIDVPNIYPAPFTVVRALVRPGVTHEAAVKEFEPYDKIRRPLPQVRLALAEIINNSLENRRGLYVYVNNRVEGHAPTTISNALNLLEQNFLKHPL
jgi:uncharacterized protein YecE (DUF72 family)